MKTTVEIADALMKQIRVIAARDGTTLRALIEDGLRQVVRERSRDAEPFALEDASVDGSGLQAGIDPGDWNRLRALAYEGRGG